MTRSSSPPLTLLKHPPEGKYSSTAPGVMAAGHVAQTPPIVSQLFSLALSPRAFGPMGGFWLGNPPAMGAVSESGGAVAAVGVNGGPDRGPRVMGSFPDREAGPGDKGHRVGFVVFTLS